jgi:NAD(P)-dependent dehydrogenase (short-subunit alcohol dehydrogenase family)
MTSSRVQGAVGTARGHHKASTLDPALLQLVTEMNLFGTVYSCNAVAPIMKQQRSGKIITVSSVAGQYLPPMAAMPITGQRKLILLSQVLELLALCGVARETPQSEPSTEFQPSDVFCLVDIGLGRASGG